MTRQRRATSPRLVRTHIVAAVAIPLCLAAGWFELTRALGGNPLSWAYVVEWPLIAGVGCYMWWRLVREERASLEGGDEDQDGDQDEPVDAPVTAGGEPVDPELQAWREYLAELHANDPPGGPPWERRDPAG